MDGIIRTDYRKLVNTLSDSSPDAWKGSPIIIDSEYIGNDNFDISNGINKDLTVHLGYRLNEWLRNTLTKHYPGVWIDRRWEEFCFAAIVKYPESFDASKEFNEYVAPNEGESKILRELEMMSCKDAVISNAMEDLKDNLIGCIRLGHVIGRTPESHILTYAKGGLIPGTFIVRIWKVVELIEEIHLPKNFPHPRSFGDPADYWRLKMPEFGPDFKYIYDDRIIDVVYRIMSRCDAQATIHDVEVEVRKANSDEKRKSGKSGTKTNDISNNSVDELEK